MVVAASQKTSLLILPLVGCLDNSVGAIIGVYLAKRTAISIVAGLLRMKETQREESMEANVDCWGEV